MHNPFLQPTLPHTPQICSSGHGLTLLASAPIGRHLAAGISAQISELITRFIQRQQAPALSLAVSSWLNFRKAKAACSTKHMAQLESRVRLLLTLLLEIQPNRLASSLTQQDAHYLRDALPKRISRQSAHQGNTLANYYNTYNLLVRHLERQGYLDKAATIEHHYRRPPSDVTQPFSGEDLQSLFDGPLYADYRHSKARWTAHAFKFWITPLSLFTGMRLNEICQLEVRDIRQKDGGGSSRSTVTRPTRA